MSLLEGDVVAEADALRPVGGYLPVPRIPATPDPALQDTYALTDTEQATWWRDRLRRVHAELAARRP